MGLCGGGGVTWISIGNREDNSFLWIVTCIVTVTNFKPKYTHAKNERPLPPPRRCCIRAKIVSLGYFLPSRHRLSWPNESENLIKIAVQTIIIVIEGPKEYSGEGGGRLYLQIRKKWMMMVDIIHYRVSYLPNARRQSHQPTSHQARELHKWISDDDDGRWHRFGSSNECGC